VSGTTHRRADSLFLIKHPVFIPLVLVCYRQSSHFLEVIEHFSALCQHSASNCVACHEGDLDFLLLELLSHRDHTFHFYGYLLQFTVNDSVAFPVILSVVCYIMRVHTSAVIIDRLLQLTIFGSSSYYPEYANLVLDHLNTAISADSHRRYPVFDMGLREAQCEIRGLTGAMLNHGFTFSFWLKIDTAKLLQRTEVFYIFRLISVTRNVNFRVFANNGNLFVSYANEEATINGQFWNSIPADAWIPFTVSMDNDGSHDSIVTFYRNRDPAPATPFPRIFFPPGAVRLLIGGVDHPEGAIQSPGCIGPFAMHCPGPALLQFVNYPFHSDPNFEHFQEATFTSDLIAHPRSSDFQFPVCHSHVGNGFLETVVRAYDLNYLAYLLLSFHVQSQPCPMAFLKMILGFMSYAIAAQREFFSVPCLAALLPSIIAPSYQIYMIFFTFISECHDQQLLHEMLGHILLNIEIWMRADFQSVARIIHHWTSAIIPTFQATFLRRWTVRRLLSVFGILFLPVIEHDIPVDTEDVGTQVDLAILFSEQCALHAFAMFHSPAETLQARELYEQYIIAVAQLRLTASDVDSLYSYCLTAESPPERSEEHTSELQSPS
jgi:hypothetical protein